MTLSIHFLADRHFHPAFADAVLLDIKTLLAIQSNADITFEYGRNMMGAAWISGEAIG